MKQKIGEHYTNENQFECECNNKKKYRLKLDGGSLGLYFVDYCQKCFEHDDKQFLLSVEKIHG